MSSLMQDSARFAALQSGYVAKQAELWATMLGCSTSFRVDAPLTQSDTSLLSQLIQPEAEGKVSFQWNNADGTALLQARRFRKGSGIVRLSVVPKTGQEKRPLTCVGNIIFLVTEPADGAILGNSKLSGFCARRIGLTDDPSLQWWRFTLIWNKRDLTNSESQFGVALIREEETNPFMEFFPAP